MMKQMDDAGSKYLGFVARRVGSAGFEIVAPTGKVFGWAVDASAAMLMALGLNRVLLDGQVVPDIGDAPVVGDGVVASDERNEHPAGMNAAPPVPQVH